MNNRKLAIEEANKIDFEIIEALQKGSHFRVDAGAGSGKTYSLIRAVEWLQENKWNEFNRMNQKVACITYTNAAVDVIRSRLKNDSFIIPSTIHSFVWEAMKQFQIDLLRNAKEILIDKDYIDFNYVKKIEYTLGKRYQDGDTLYLFHDDVIKLFVILIDKPKFRTILSNQYPIILIDEYQDSFKSIVDKFVEYFIENKSTPQFGFFGDSWQTIYQMQGAVGEINSDNIVIIQKKSNFRSASKIVEMLNRIRPELQQITAEDNYEGSTTIIDCSDYKGSRIQGGLFSNDLPNDVLMERIENLENVLYRDLTKTCKTLFLTHRIIASNEGYPDLLNLFDDGFKDKTDAFLLFFMEKVELIVSGLEQGLTQQIFDVLGLKQYPINAISDKKKWYKFKDDIFTSRNKKVIDVLDSINNSGLLTFPEEIEKIYSNYPKNNEEPYRNGSIGKLMNLDYSQILAAISYHKPNSLVSTNHGVKGEEYDNVIFVVSKGWNNYNFDKYLPMSQKEQKDNYESYKRNRNLFYVCCSRAKSNFIMFITYPVSNGFKEYLTNLVGINNYMSYDQYIKQNNA
ncbi:MAG: UvrD-helicase domain-containing protein [Candidatus Izemoplasmatales bacterium]